MFIISGSKIVSKTKNINLVARTVIPIRIASLDSNHHSSKQYSSIPNKRTKFRSYIELMRWHKPAGTILALTPSLWSLCLATPASSPNPDLTTMAIFSAGALVARGMGCTINDLIDKDFDKYVERTKNRPIACGDISSKEALAFLTAQSALGLFILCLNNSAVIQLGCFSTLMIAGYPLFKRFTDWPQLMLAFTINWGVLMGFAAAKGSIAFSDINCVLPVYTASILWTLFYDTIYAHQDKIDDMFVGIKSTALRLGSKTKSFLYATATGMSISLTLAGISTGQTWPFYATIASTLFLHSSQVRSLNLDDKLQCWNIFEAQQYIGILILVGLLSSVFLNYRRNHSETKSNNNTSKVTILESKI